jgi:DNA-binding response OmpR family regulator
MGDLDVLRYHRPHIRNYSSIHTSTSKFSSIMNACLSAPIFTQWTPFPHCENEAQFRGVTIPTNALAAKAFYQGLPILGSAVRQTCRQRPEAKMDEVIAFGLEVLQIHAFDLGHDKTNNFDALALAWIQSTLSHVYGKIDWDLPDDEIFMATGDEDPSRRPVVLAADDCPISRAVMAKVLRKGGFEPQMVADGADILLMTPIYRPSLILLDMQMEQLDGVPTCAILQLSKLVDLPPVIFLSGNTADDAIADGLAAGGVDYIIKPFDIHQALIRIQKHLRRTQPAPPPPPTRDEEPLIQLENVVEYIGNDPEDQQLMFNLCLNVVTEKLPLLRRAMDTGDRLAIQRLAHALRGSLGMLGLPVLLQITEEIEYDHDELGAKVWNERCQQLCQLLDRIHDELRQRHAA